jgi:hypothetical protein
MNLAERESFAGDPILRVVEVNTHSFGRETLTALRIIRKQVPHMLAA